ncbi:MAG TPA: NADH-quinone oxidoreductase subunit J [Methanoregula sp.]|nr:NADH-quinone oxidoreductase subunit J [Methanoregula sp.]
MSDIDFLIMAVLGAGTIMAALIAIVNKNFIRAVIAYAISSICLAALFFLLASPFAGVLELTVGAGLVAALFLVTLILAGGEEEEVSA